MISQVKKNKKKGARGQEVDWGRGWEKKRGMHGPHQQPEIQRGLMQKAETNIIVLTCCPGCEANAKSSPHTLSKVANMESDAAYRGRVKGERGRKERQRMRRKGVKEMERKLTYETCKITTSQGRGRLDRRSIGTRR